MKLRKIAALVGSAALATSLIGAGVGATFTATTSSYEAITVGTMTIAASPASCTVTVLTPDGNTTCTVKLSSTGTIMPASVQMTPSISGTSLAQPTLWTLSDNAGGHTTLAALATFNYPVFVDGNSVIYTITWAGLDNHSLGNSFYVTFNFTASL